jgi:hypothetical protein
MPTTKGARGKGGAQNEAGTAGDVDALFQLPLVEFTAARNALASRLKKAGQAGEAEQVKGLAKPSLSAWVVNQVYWRHRTAFDRLLDAGEQFRKAQAAQLAGKSGDLRETLEARRTALAALSRVAAGVVRDAGHTATPDTMRRITTTLEALSVYGSLPEAPPAGRLTDDVDPPGFETLAALVPRIGKSGKGDEPTRIIPFQQTKKKPSRKGGSTADPQKQEEERQAQLARAKAAVKEADAALREARRAAQQAEAALKKAAAHAKEAEKEKTAAEERLEKAAAAADEARHQARRVAAEAEDAAQAVEDAERALEKAQREMERVP